MDINRFLFDIHLTNSQPKNYLIEIGLPFIGWVFGGYFSAYFSNDFEQKRVAKEKRQEKFLIHRSTLVQIEHELLPARIDMSRNISTLKDAIDNTYEDDSEIRIRLILRMYSLFITSGLSLNMLDLKIINNYSTTYSLISKVNSDIKYLDGLVKLIQRDKDDGKVDESKLETYRLSINTLIQSFKELDREILQLLSMTRLSLQRIDRKRENYIKTGIYQEDKYSKPETREVKKEVLRQEKDTKSNKGRSNKFVAYYLDFIRQKIKIV